MAHRGFEGYGRFTYLLETAARAEGNVIADDPEWLAAEMRMDEAELEGFMGDLVEWGLLAEAEGGWRSPDIDESAERYRRTCERNRRNIQRRWRGKGDAA